MRTRAEGSIQPPEGLGLRSPARMVEADALKSVASSRFGLSRRLKLPLKQGWKGWR